MKYQVARHGPGGIDYVVVEADSGDEAATLAYRPGCFIKGIEPAPAEPEADRPKRGRPALQGE